MLIFIVSLALSLLGFLRRKSSHIRQKTQIDYIIDAVLLTCACACAYMAWNAPFNLLHGMDAYPTDAGYILRNKFREYMSRIYPSWSENSDLSTFSDTQQLQILQLEKLYDQFLRDKNSRQLYLSVGHDSYMNCSWCVEKFDYQLYNSPVVLFSYCLFLSVIGIVSITRRKQFWRWYGTLFSMAIFMVELYIQYFNDDIIEMGSIEKSCHVLRYAAFGVLFLLMWLIGSSSLDTNEQLENILDTLQQHYVHTQISNQAEKVVSDMDDSEMMKRILQTRSEELNKNYITQKIPVKYNPMKVFQEVMNYIEMSKMKQKDEKQE